MLPALITAVLSILPPLEYCAPLADTDRETLCEAAPWGRPSCNFEATAEKCHNLLDVVEACDITDCEYIQCATDMWLAPCGVRPDSCELIAKCFNGMTEPAPEPPPSYDIDPDDPFVYGCSYSETFTPDDTSPKACSIMLAKCIDATIETCADDPDHCFDQQETCWVNAQICWFSE